MKRVTKKDGLIFVLVWAFERYEQSKHTYKQQDVIIPWKSKDRTILGQRYYHLFTQCEIHELFKSEIYELFHEKNNWGIILKNTVGHNT